MWQHLDEEDLPQIPSGLAGLSHTWPASPLRCTFVLLDTHSRA